MTNDGGNPYEPKPDPETPSTRPVPEPSPGAQQPPVSDPAAPPRSVPPQQPAADRAASSEAGPPHGQPPAAQQHGYAPAPPKNDLGVWALVTGILSYVMCPLVLGIAAIITGTKSRRAADEGLANNRGMGTAGVILGWINVALAILVVAFFVVAIAGGFFVGGVSEMKDMNDMNMDY